MQITKQNQSFVAWHKLSTYKRFQHKNNTEKSTPNTGHAFLLKGNFMSRKNPMSYPYLKISQVVCYVFQYLLISLCLRDLINSILRRKITSKGEAEITASPLPPSHFRRERTKFILFLLQYRKKQREMIFSATRKNLSSVFLIKSDTNLSV